MTFLYVPPGRFMMGDTFGDGFENELPVHPVQMDAFFMGKYPVTQAQWEVLMGTNPSKFKSRLHPVEQVSWADTHRFIEELTKADNGTFRFSLPTEAQWEYAARSGGREERYAGGGDVDAVAWYEDNAGESTRPVGLKAPNGLGLHDMSGNVWEWCQDNFQSDAYRRHHPQNPVFTGKGPDRVIRGGSWNLDAWSVRCARRFSFREDFLAPGLGFRLVMAVQGP
ncbi:MAG: formylglycine-generating enzyme family protein [Desulfatiglandales bacterium]